MRDFTLERWRALDDPGREQLAEALARELPAGFAFEGVTSHRMGVTENAVAAFTFDSARFVLIPGGLVPVGFDAAAWKPTRREAVDLRETQEEYDAPPLRERLAAVMAPPGEAAVAPLLMEVDAATPGWEPISAGDPRVLKLLRDHPDSGQVTSHFEGGALRVTRSEGRVAAHLLTTSTHADIAARFHAAGFRLPTEAEWEFACGAGARTLYRWGGHVPPERLAAGPDRLTLRPSAWGVRIAFDTYKMELVAEPGRTRGCAVCGGCGLVAGYLPLATAYREEDFCAREPGAAVDDFYVARRVLALG